MITKDKIYDVLRECYDPEIPVNIVDLGLVYDVAVSGDKIHVKMTLTTPGCGLARMICSEVQDRLARTEGVSDAQVELVWDPPWNPAMMSETARKQLGLE